MGPVGLHCQAQGLEVHNPPPRSSIPFAGLVGVGCWQGYVGGIMVVVPSFTIICDRYPNSLSRHIPTLKTRIKAVDWHLGSLVPGDSDTKDRLLQIRNGVIERLEDAINGRRFLRPNRTRRLPFHLGVDEDKPNANKEYGS